MSKTIRIALLLCATPIPTVLAEHGDYTAMFTRVFRDSLPKESGCEVHIDPYDVRTKMEYPDESQMGGDDGYKAVVMTGSGSNAYDDIPWINKLVDYIAWLAKAKPDIKIFGICFGHQIVARALGGRCVVNGGKWEIGPCEVEMTDLGQQIFGANVLNIEQMHRDHVPEVPPSFHLLGRSPTTPVQGLVKFDSPSPTNTQVTSVNPPSSELPPTKRTLKDIHILTLQGHPEFTGPIVNKIIDAREEAGILKGDIVTVAREKESAGWRNDGVTVVGKTFWDVLLP